MQVFFFYHDFFDVFNKAIFEILFEHASHDHAIDIEKKQISNRFTIYLCSN